jgi:sporulation protein YlmC with PRC-barrel domain
VEQGIGKEEGSMHLKLADLPGRPVLDANGAVIGDIKVPLVDSETWLVDTLRITIRKRAAREMALAWSFFKRPTLDVPTGLIHAAGDAIILRVSMAELRETPPVTTADEQAAPIH